MASRTEARFSTYSGAPSLQPSLAPTIESTARSSTHAPSGRSTYTHAAASEKAASDMYRSGGSATGSTSTLSSTDPRTAELKSWSGALERMQDARLDKQRYVMSGHKSDEVSKLALGAKVERALARRMVGQDAVPRPKKRLDTEKPSLEVEAN